MEENQHRGPITPEYKEMICAWREARVAKAIKQLGTRYLCHPDNRVTRENCNVQSFHLPPNFPTSQSRHR